jgi:hypothetical protein
MPRIRIALLATVATLALAGTAEATPIVIGSPLTGSFAPVSSNENEGTLLNLSPGEAGAHATSPVTGAIVRWHILDGKGGPFRLRVLRPVGGASYAAVGSSGPTTPFGLGLETFPVAIPIQAGDTVGIDSPKKVELGLFLTPTSTVAYWIPPLPEGSNQAFTSSTPGAEYGFNAEVQPQPTVTGVTPASGSFNGRSAVTISGTDFTTVSAVRFGLNAAISFAVGSETQITAVAPPGTPGTTDITVTTVAGTSPVTAADQFRYTACVVPNLNAKKLKAAKKKLRKAGCKAGKVTREDGVTAKTGKVVGQSPKPGGKLKSGTKVKLILG